MHSNAIILGQLSSIIGAVDSNLFKVFESNLCQQTNTFNNIPPIKIFNYENLAYPKKLKVKLLTACLANKYLTKTVTT